MRLITGGAKEAPELVAEAVEAIRRSMFNLNPAALAAADGEGGKGPFDGGRQSMLAANRRGGGLRAKVQPGIAARRGLVANGRKPRARRDDEGEAADHTHINVPAALLAPEAAEVAAAAGADGAAAARREALFERLHRQRAEAMLAATRSEETGGRADGKS